MTARAAVPRRAMILAAGLGERMRPLTLRRAKPALPLLNRALISEIARRLSSAGVRELVVNLHHQPQSVRAALEHGAAAGLKLIYSEEKPLVLGTGGGVARARPHLEGSPFLLINGDSLSCCDLAALARAHRRAGALATLVARPLAPGDPYRALEADAQGRLWRIAGRPSAPLVPPHGLLRYVFTGIHLIDEELFEFFPDRESFDINHDVYPAVLEAGRRVAVFPDASDWYEIGNPDLYLAASLRLLDGGGLPGAPERAVAPGIFAAAGVTGLARARLETPVWVGAGARLGEGARLRRCVVGPRCEIEEGAQVEDTVLLEGSHVGCGAHLRNAIVEEGVRVPSGAELRAQLLVRENDGMISYALSLRQPVAQPGQGG